MQTGTVRIIGGKWRGRKLLVPDLPGLRPTPDRVKETLFNWLAPHLPGAYCLDMFAGSGALGFEALSRGAEFVVMVDQSAQVVAALQKQLQTFDASNALIYQAKAPTQLKKADKPFDIVFLDPPFQDSILLSSCEYLEAQGLLADIAYIYLETPTLLTAETLPKNWELIRAKQAGQVAYHLALRQGLA